MIGEPIRHKPRRSLWEAFAVLAAVVLPLVVGVLAMASTGRAAAPEPLPSRAAEPPPPVAGLIVNLNTADAAQLSLVPGLTPARVKAILEWRQRHSFQAPIDLLKVKGIGLTTWQKAKPWVAVDGPAVRTVVRPATDEELLAGAG